SGQGWGGLGCSRGNENSPPRASRSAEGSVDELTHANRRFAAAHAPRSFDDSGWMSVPHESGDLLRQPLRAPPSPLRQLVTVARRASVTFSNGRLRLRHWARSKPERLSRPTLPVGACESSGKPT